MNLFEQPLVSIIVITYNSSKFVLETLESAKTQTYQNIELIVSDDASTDNTVELCRVWIDKNKERFVRTELITVEKNTGIPANCNRGLKASRGEYIKFIAGDDLILNKYVELCIDYFRKDHSVGLVYTNTILIDSKGNHIKKISNKNYKQGYIFKEIFFLKFWPSAPSLCFKKEALIKVGTFNENIAVEDYYIVLKIAQIYKICHINQYLTLYRRHDSNFSNKGLFIIYFHIKTINYFKEYKYFSKRKKQLITALINSLSYYNKKRAIKMILKNLNNLSLNHNLFKAIIKLLLPKKIFILKRKFKVIR